MARLSKTTPFHIYSDADASTLEPTEDLSSEGNVKHGEELEKTAGWTGGRRDDGFVTESDDDAKAGLDERAQEGDDEKNYTRTSISSLPESNYPTDFERTPMHKPYTPTYSRPSVRRMQMSSPLRKSRYGTPQSEPRGSPRAKIRGNDNDLDERESRQLPLVLLHITVLPVNIPWSVQAMREVLPSHTLESMQLLRSKLSGNVVKRGILIPHPRDDYELLEEKLLEALELQQPLLTKCGHYRNRHSTDSTMTAGSGSNDSGMGSSVEESDDEHCSTCHHHLKAAGSGKQKWSIRVFAANGLMHASAWSAAWSEMERVDVEIMSYIKDDLRIKLDEMESQAHAVVHIDREEEERRVNQMVEDRMRILEDDAERAREAAMAREIEQIVMNEQRQQANATPDAGLGHAEKPKTSEPAYTDEAASTELPDIYRHKDIPLSILLRNYTFLLMRKRANLVTLLFITAISGLLLTLDSTALYMPSIDISTLSMQTSESVGPLLGIPSAPKPQSGGGGSPVGLLDAKVDDSLMDPETAHTVATYPAVITEHSVVQDLAAARTVAGSLEPTSGLPIENGPHAEERHPQNEDAIPHEQSNIDGSQSVENGDNFEKVEEMGEPLPEGLKQGLFDQCPPASSLPIDLTRCVANEEDLEHATAPASAIADDAANLPSDVSHARRYETCMFMPLTLEELSQCSVMEGQDEDIHPLV
ncbi:hypothetical protein WHR41_03695 [Cladosporium halotolerans]|uniref:Pathway-specific nitrogen regulator n=1 Tax=Cladosporium halotolerans TaxID=1052096 RepID=A0AB34KV08_9PEZI